MDINQIKDENTFKDPSVLEIVFYMIPALMSIIAIVQIHEINKENNRIRENENQINKVKNEVLKLENLSDAIMDLLAIVASKKNFNLDGKVTIKDTLLLLEQNEFFRYQQLERALKSVENELYILKHDLRSSATKNNLNININVNDPLVTSFDSLLSDMDEVSIVDFMTGLTDLTSEVSKRLTGFDVPKLR